MWDVMKTLCHIINIIIVVQKIDKKAMRSSGMVARVRNEVEIHCQLKHPSILEVRLSSTTGMYAPQSLII